MTSPAQSTGSPVPNVRSWLARLARSGGLASRLSVALPIVGGALLLPQSWWLAHALHRAIADGAPLTDLSVPVGIFAALLIARIVIGLTAELFAVSASERVKQRLRRALAGTALAHPPTWTAERASGALATSIIEQVDAMDGYLTRYLPAMAQAAILPLAFAAALIPFDWMVALLLLIAAPLIPVFMALAGWGAEDASRRQATALTRLGGYFADRLRGITTLKLLGREQTEADAVGVASELLRLRTMRVMRIAFLSSAVLEFFAALGVAGVALYVGLTFLNLVHLRATPLPLEAGLFCLLMAPEIFQPLRLLAANYHDQAAAKGAAAEIAAQYGDLGALEPPALQQPEVTVDMVAPALVLSDVTIAAPDGRPVIVGAHAEIAAGERIAILGASGSGKSTLLETLAGLRPYQGSIGFDGRELSSIPPSLLRARVGVLGQRPTIFATSIAGNIQLGRRTACATSVEVAARRANVAEFAAEQPDGLETLLGEAGAGLSGGEIHRIALARIYLRDPGLLLLDEPTAHLDAVTETAVLHSLLEFARGRTLIIVTHSPSVAARMDRSLRLAGGQLLPCLQPQLSEPGLRGAA